MFLWEQETKETMCSVFVLLVFQEPKVDPFNDSNTGFGDDFKPNGFSSDPFGSSGFDARSGFDDSFGNTFPNRTDAFGGSAASDPFGDKRGGVPPVTPDVSRNFILGKSGLMKNCFFSSFSRIKMTLEVIHSPYCMHRQRLVMV